jgi:uncharacterized membrane protein
MNLLPLRKPLLRISAFSGIVALMVGAYMMWVAWDHNPQGAYHEEGVVHWGDWLAIGISWMVVVFFVLLICLASLSPLVSYSRRKTNKKD